MTKDTHGQREPGWIGVDLDGTLAEYNGWVGPDHIGDPIPKMKARVLDWIEKGFRVKIMTARVHPSQPDNEQRKASIQKWLAKHIYPECPIWFREPWPCELELTHEKDFLMLELWDDRCVQVIPNTGERADGKE